MLGVDWRRIMAGPRSRRKTASRSESARSRSSGDAKAAPPKTGKSPSQELPVDEAIERAVGVTLDDLTAFFVLLAVKGFGPQKFKELHENGLRAVDVVHGRAELPTAGKRGDMLRAQLAEEVQSLLPLSRGRASRQLHAAKSLGGRILTYHHSAYPKNVFESNNPVPILFARGAFDLLKNRRVVACVGSRQIRPPYDELHRAFSRVACDEGFAISSGFALGADSIGHTAALAAQGRTICVMPCGLDRPFPPENRDLWDRLLDDEGGVFISEFPFGTRASSLTLRRRNKLIVGAALGVLVSQSSTTGGAMNAYRFGLEQRKPIATFAADGKPDTSGNAAMANPTSRKATGDRRTANLGPPAAAHAFSLERPDREAYRRWLRSLSSSI
jgi:DNA protecting protein DprA